MYLALNLKINLTTPMRLNCLNLIYITFGQFTLIGVVAANNTVFERFIFILNA